MNFKGGKLIKSYSAKITDAVGGGNLNLFDSNNICISKYRHL